MEKQLGSEAKLDMSFSEGKISISAIYDGKGADAKVELMFESIYFLDLLAEKIPGEVDDLILDALKKALS